MAEGGAKRDWFAPIVADAEAGFGGPLNCFEMMKAMIEAGAAGEHTQRLLDKRFPACFLHLPIALTNTLWLLRTWLSFLLERSNESREPQTSGTKTFAAHLAPSRAALLQCDVLRTS